MFEELDSFTTSGVPNAASTSLEVDLMIVADQLANREHWSGDSHVVGLNRDPLIVYHTFAADCTELLENSPTLCLTPHRSHFGVALADVMLWRFNVGVDGMYKAPRVDHAQGLIWCYLDLRQLLHCLRLTFLVSRQRGHDVAGCIGIIVVADNDGVVLRLLPALDPLSCMVCFLSATGHRIFRRRNVHLVRRAG